jgi:phospholipid/cholesterol/gamma-HCH transport system substrate-binding protein
VNAAGPRIAAVAVLVIAAIVAAIVLFAGAEPYRVTARMVTASQLVKGNEVTVAGQKVGTVEDIRVGDDSMAEVDLAIEPDYAPLRKGTRAVVRQLSLSGQANRYLDLQLGGADGSKIPSGGTIPAQDVSEAVELDELFDVFDAKTRPQIQKTVKLLSEFGAGRTDEANAALQYLNPALSASSRLFNELSRDRPALEKFIVETGRLTGDLAAKDTELKGVVQNLGTTMNALATERDDLGESVERLPLFLRRTNSTFVNLRAALDDLDPLVADAKPVVKNDIPPLLDQLRPFAKAAEPTVQDLSKTIQAPGADNDLIDLLKTQPAVANIAVESADRNGKTRPGAFQQAQDAVKGATPQLNFVRPYTPDLVGWFDDFSTSGMYDALGGFSRAGLQLNGFTLDPALNALPVPPELRKQLLGSVGGVQTGRNNRCPGAAERPAADGSNPWKPSEDFNCDLKQVPPGP